LLCEYKINITESSNVNLKLNFRNDSRQANESYPDRIIIFRDGVGDGQMRELMGQEVQPIQEILKDICPTMPKFSFIVVQKRINERMFINKGVSKMWDFK
jgi:hypothetical protein